MGTAISSPGNPRFFCVSDLKQPELGAL